MGTNYYLHMHGGNMCDHCGRSDGREELHIGKSSCGWCFSLHVIPEKGIHNIKDWKNIFSDGIIRNEYGDTLTAEAMLDQITKRKRNLAWGDSAWYGYKDESDFHAKNHSERGPNNLLRHKIDGRHCLGHGEGTWDYIAGEFS